MQSLAAFQAAFFADLLRAPEALASAALTAVSAQPGFAVYRNTVMAGCIDALAANYPSVQRLLGDDGFRQVARAFVRVSPPAGGVLADYGAGFAAFLRELASAADLPYLPGVAGLDRLWTEAHLAADAPVLQAVAVLGLAPAAFASARLAVHPAARWQHVDEVPAFTVWRRHRESLALDGPLAWRGEGALLTRPGAAVRWIGIDASAVAFLSACAAGRTVADAFDAALAIVTKATPFAGLPPLILAGAFSRIEPGRAT